MVDNGVLGVTLDDCKDIIAEFDSNQDGTLNYDEFLNIFLPAADYGLRNVQYFPDPRASPFNVLGMPPSVPAMAARILERERTFSHRLRDARIALNVVSAQDMNSIFRDISRGHPDIQMQDLIWFLDVNGYQPKTEDLEAILRRCDHDADRALSLEEFAEACGHNYQVLIDQRDAALATFKADRDAKLAAHQAEMEAKRLEWESKLEAERLEREKRLEEMRIEQEAAKAAREKELELARLEREKQIEEWRLAQEAARIEHEKKLEIERMEREKRAE